MADLPLIQSSPLSPHRAGPTLLPRGCSSRAQRARCLQQPCKTCARMLLPGAPLLRRCYRATLSPEHEAVRNAHQKWSPGLRELSTCKARVPPAPKLWLHRQRKAKGLSAEGLYAGVEKGREASLQDVRGNIAWFAADMEDVNDLLAGVDRIAASKARLDPNNTSMALERHAAASMPLRGLQSKDWVSRPPHDLEKAPSSNPLAVSGL